MAGMTEKQAEPLDLVYGLEDKPPFGNALLSAVTHLLAIFCSDDYSGTDCRRGIGAAG